MALTTLSFFALAFASLIFSATGQATNNLRCYFCESQVTRACEDPMDATVVRLVDCSSFDQISSRRAPHNITEVISNTVDGKFRAGPIIDEIFQRNGAQKPFKYVCVKATLTKDDTKGMTRECAKVPTDITDACDFIIQETNPLITVHSCYACETDRCNSASFLIVSGITTLFSVFFVMLITML